MQLSDIMTSTVLTLEPEKTVMDAAKMMQKHNIGTVPVCDASGTLAGIITDRDIVVRSIANNQNPQTTQIRSIMTEDVITGQPDMDVDTAFKIMAHYQIRRLPIVRNGKVEGIISLGDLTTRYFTDDEVIDTLTEISEPSRPENIM